MSPFYFRKIVRFYPRTRILIILVFWKLVFKVKRCILISSRKGTDKETNDNLLFLTMYALPVRTQNGNLYYPKSEQALINMCINEKYKPQDYSDLSDIKPGSLVDITYGSNELTQKMYVKKIELVPGTNLFTDDLLYLEQ